MLLYLFIVLFVIKTKKNLLCQIYDFEVLVFLVLEKKLYYYNVFYYMPAFIVQKMKNKLLIICCLYYNRLWNISNVIEKIGQNQN